jgi:hypothetical protein
MHKGFVLRPKDYVHVVSGAEAEGETMGRPFMGRITACWRDDAGEGGVSVRWYIRAEEVGLLRRSPLHDSYFSCADITPHAHAKHRPDSGRSHTNRYVDTPIFHLHTYISKRTPRQTRSRTTPSST